MWRLRGSSAAGTHASGSVRRLSAGRGRPNAGTTGRCTCSLGNRGIELGDERATPDSKGEVIERGPQLGKALDHTPWEEEAWEYVHFLGAHAASLETRAAIVVPAQIAGLIALWTQLFTFEGTAAHVCMGRVGL